MVEPGTDRCGLLLGDKIYKDAVRILSVKQRQTNVEQHCQHRRVPQPAAHKFPDVQHARRKQPLVAVHTHSWKKHRVNQGPERFPSRLVVAALVPPAHADDLNADAKKLPRGLNGGETIIPPNPAVSYRPPARQLQLQQRWPAKGFTTQCARVREESVRSAASVTPFAKTCSNGVNN
jgi:hypothetical protein